MERFGFNLDDTEKDTAKKSAERKNSEGKNRRRVPSMDAEITREMEMLDIEHWPEKAPKIKERLSEQEASLYQDYAAGVESKKFSEKASEESYREAEELLKELKHRQFDFLKIDWRKLDLSDAFWREDIEERLQAAVYELAKASGNFETLEELEKKSGKKSNGYLAFLASSLLALSSPSFSSAENFGEENVYRAEETAKKKTAADYLKGLDATYFSPHLKFDEKGRFQWENLWKAVLEPLAVAFSKTSPERAKIEISIPYEYARLFDVGKPINQEDYQRLNSYIESKLLEELKESVLAFSWDEEALREKAPEFLDVSKIKITHIGLIGSASPEARTRESVQAGQKDEENIKLARLRAENAVKNIKDVLRKLGIQHDPKKISVGQVETQFSDPEMEALEQIAFRHGKDVFGLIKSFNRGELGVKEDIEALDAIVASKRKVVAIFETEGSAPRAIVLPLPLLLGLLPFIRRIPGVSQRGGARIGLPSRFNFKSVLPGKIGDFEKITAEKIHGKKELKAVKMGGAEKAPEPAKINFAAKTRAAVVKKSLKLDSEEIEFKAAEVLDDVLRSPELYERIAQRHVLDDFEKESVSLEAVAGDILSTWEEIDNAVRQRAGIAEKADYFNSDHQKLYAELHARVVRKWAMLIKEGKSLSENPVLKRKELEKIIKEEFKTYKKI